MCNWPPCWPHSWIAVQVIKGNHLLQIRFLPLIIYLFLNRHRHMPIISSIAYHLLPLLDSCLFFTFFCSQGLEQWVKTPPFTVLLSFSPSISEASGECYSEYRCSPLFWLHYEFVFINMKWLWVSVPTFDFCHQIPYWELPLPLSPPTLHFSGRPLPPHLLLTFSFWYLFKVCLNN